MNKQEKIFIIGSRNIDKYKIAKNIANIHDSFNIAKTFTTDISMKDKITDSFKYYLSPKEVEMSFKNNALMYVNTDRIISVGVTLEDMYNEDIFVLDFYDFNNMSNKIFNEISPIIIWIDSKDKNYDYYKDDVNESKYSFEKININNLKVMYFVNETPIEIAKIVLDYYNGDDIVREQLLEENS